MASPLNMYHDDNSLDSIDEEIDRENGASSKIHPVRSYFTFDDNIERNVCKLGGCKIKSKSANDLYRHVQRKHKQIAEKDDIKSKVEKYRQRIGKIGVDDDDEVEVTVRVKKSKIIKSCVELTTINGRPLGLVEDSGFKRLVQPIVQAINQKTATRLTLNRDAMIENAEKSLTHIKNQIKKETEN